jgi:hypothetical protein
MALHFALWLASVAAAKVQAGSQDLSSCASLPEPDSRQCREENVDQQPVVASDHLLLQLGKASVEEQRTSGSVGQQWSCHLHDVERKCSPDGCRVLATNMRGRSCSSYCALAGYTCIGAWEEVNEDCNVKQTLTCEDSSVPTSDLICQCAPPGSSPKDLGSLNGLVPLSTFFWNVHWECSMAARGASDACKHRVGRRFASLAHAAGAEVVASIELSDGSSKPASLPGFGLKGWTQVDGPCAHGFRGDSAALAFAPGWQVQKSGGGCLRHDSDTRAFAVARVVPPKPVKGCPTLCVVAIHAPHASITKGKETVWKVCGSSAQGCAVAMGDWNVAAERVGSLWSKIIGGALPPVALPNERTCCFPESHHYGVFDHIATNIKGAVHDTQTVHPYQVLEENPVKQHKAVAARLLLPGGH